jgi:4'-phosphopantetheinyl transferase EntD
VIEAVLPPGVAAAERFHDGPEDEAGLFPEELRLVERSVARRRAEFRSGRLCARRALATLGEVPVPILTDARGAPLWPAGVVGSITHCNGYRAAAVARTDVLASLGIDAEPNEPLPRGVYELVTANSAEQQQVRSLQASLPHVSWDRLLFTAKEAVYKAWYPFAQRLIDFSEAEVLLFARTSFSGGFTARLLSPGPVVRGVRHTTLAGNWALSNGFLVSATCLPAQLAPVPPRAVPAT